MTVRDELRAVRPVPFIGLDDCCVAEVRVNGEGQPECSALGIPMPTKIKAACPRRQTEYLAGRTCAMKALGQHLPELPRPLLADEDGRPLWPEGFTGSITHSKNLAAAIVLPVDDAVGGVGIDLEDCLGDDAAENIRSHIATSAEIGLFLRSGWAPARAITVIFSLKESFFKALAPEWQRGFNLASCRLHWTDSLASRAQLSYTAPDTGQAISLTARFERHGTMLFTSVLRPPEAAMRRVMPAAGQSGPPHFIATPRPALFG